MVRAKGAVLVGFVGFVGLAGLAVDVAGPCVCVGRWPVRAPPWLSLCVCSVRMPLLAVLDSSAAMWDVSVLHSCIVRLLCATKLCTRLSKRSMTSGSLGSSGSGCECASCRPVKNKSVRNPKMGFFLFLAINRIGVKLYFSFTD